LLGRASDEPVNSVTVCQAVPAIFLAQALETMTESGPYLYPGSSEKSDFTSTLQHDFPFWSVQSCKVQCVYWFHLRNSAQLKLWLAPASYVLR
jgi:hypothetical protein